MERGQLFNYLISPLDEAHFSVQASPDIKIEIHGVVSEFVLQKNIFQIFYELKWRSSQLRDWKQQKIQKIIDE